MRSIELQKSAFKLKGIKNIEVRMDTLLLDFNVSKFDNITDYKKSVPGIDFLFVEYMLIEVEFWEITESGITLFEETLWCDWDYKLKEWSIETMGWEWIGKKGGPSLKWRQKTLTKRSTPMDIVEKFLELRAKK